MSINLTGTGGLYPRLGRIGRVLLSLAEFRAGGLGSDVESMAAEYDTLRDVMAPVTDAQESARQAAGALVTALTLAAQQTLLDMVQDDQPARTWTLEEAVAEVVRQTDDTGETVSTCTTTAAETALSPFAGDGFVVLTIRGGGGESVAGEDLQNLFAETLWLTCTADAQQGDAERYQELFRFRGGVAEPDPWSDRWPAGSGGTATFTAADPATDAASSLLSLGNQLTNSSFDICTVANTPDNWVIDTGAAGTQIVGPAAVSSYDGVGCLSLPGNATAAALSQTFGDSDDGTAATLAPLTRYAVAVRTKVSAAPSTGTLILELTDSNNVVLTDPQGANLRVTIDLTAETSSYAVHKSVWVTPRSLPVTAKFRVRVGTAIQVGKTAYADHLVLAPMVECYPGGPAALAVSGVTPFVAGDGWTILAANDRNSADYFATWQAFLDNLFGLRELRLQLPSTAGAPTIEDPLITS